jgi:hypothetical protein
MSQQAVSADIIPNSAVGKFSLKHKEKRYSITSWVLLIRWLPHKFRNLKILGPLSNCKIQP